MVSRYNNGEISNEDMRNFLTKMSDGIGLSDSDKLDVQNQIKSFDSKIQLEKLTANYKAAPDNSLAQLQAAQAIASFLQAKASTQQPGTPAQSQTLQDAADWNNRVISVKDSINKVASQNLRYKEELKVNAISDNTSEQASQKAEMYKTLYDKAVADGDEVGANKYAAYYQDAITKAQDLSVKESTKSEKDDITNILNSYVNAYHDGQINESQYLQLLAEIAPRIDATGDYGLINSLNRTTDTIQKNLDKGGLKRGTTAGGLPVVLGKNKGGSGSGVVTDWDQADYQYTDTLRVYKKAFDEGKIDGEQYREGTGKAIMTHYNEINNMITALEATAEINPNTKVMFEGKKTKVSDALEKLYGDQEDLQGQAQAVEKGTFALVEVPPGQFSAAGKVTNGKAFATYKPIDTNNLPKDQYVQDNEGIFHYIQKTLLPLNKSGLDQASMGQAMQLGGFYDEAGNFIKVTKNSSGQPVFESGEENIKAYKPGTSQSISVGRDLSPSNKKILSGDPNIVPSYSAAERMQKQDIEKKKILAGRSLVEYSKTLTSTPIQKTDPVKTVVPVEPKMAPVQDVVSNIVSPIKPIVLPPTASVQGANIPSATNNLQVPTGVIKSAPSATTLQMPSSKPSPVVQMAQSNNYKPVPIPAPVKNPPKINQAQINATDKALAAQRAKANNPIGTVINNLKNLFKF